MLGQFLPWVWGSGNKAKLLAAGGLLFPDGTTQTTAATSGATLEDAIVNGENTKGSTQNAIFDALALKANAANPAFTGTPTGLTATHVGLGSVDNTSDASKPVSTAQATAIALKDTILDPAVNPDLYCIFQTDFTDDDRATLTAASNAGGGAGQSVAESSTGVNSTENCLGVMDLITGTGTTARAALISAGNLRIGSQKIRFGARAAVSAISDGTNTYTTYIGFIDNSGAGDNTDGLYFRYTSGVNSGKWEAVVASAGVRAAADTGITPAGTVNDVFEVEVNQAGTSATFYINGALTNTVSSGLPTTGDLFVYGAKIEKSAGGTSRTFSLDWFYFKTTRTTAR